MSSPECEVFWKLGEDVAAGEASKEASDYIPSSLRSHAR
jgi:hypothetical protein